MSEEMAFFYSVLVTYILYLHHKLYMLRKELSNFIRFLLTDEEVNSKEESVNEKQGRINTCRKGKDC